MIKAMKTISKPALAMFAVLAVSALVVGCGPRGENADRQTGYASHLVMIGDSDVIRPEHAVQMFRLLGGGVAGDVAGLPRSQLAVLPGTTHVTLLDRADWLISMNTAFLDAPMPKAR